MSPVLAGAIAGLIVGLPGTAVALYVAIQNRRSAQATQALAERQQTVAEGREDREADVSEDQQLRDLRKDVDALWKQLGDERRAREQAEKRAADAEERAAAAERQVSDLTGRVAHLEEELAAARGTGS